MEQIGERAMRLSVSPGTRRFSSLVKAALNVDKISASMRAGIAIATALCISESVPCAIAKISIGQGRTVTLWHWPHWRIVVALHTGPLAEQSHIRFNPITKRSFSGKSLL